MGRTQHRIRPPGTYFITVDCWGSRQLLKGEVAETLSDQVLQCRSKGYYLLHEFCVLPNHLHLLFTPTGNTSLEKAVQMIKGGASYRIRKQRKFLQLWQDGYHDWRCRDEKGYRAYAEYIRQNPVEAGVVAAAADWPYSSANPKFAEFLDPIPQSLKALKKGRPVMSTLKG
ncbi:MAG: REP-associated tyrosine transposase [Candidatus Acidiferrales bacterium]